MSEGRSEGRRAAAGAAQPGLQGRGAGASLTLEAAGVGVRAQGVPALGNAHALLGSAGVQARCGRELQRPGEPRGQAPQLPQHPGWQAALLLAPGGDGLSGRFPGVPAPSLRDQPLYKAMGCPAAGVESLRSAFIGIASRAFTRAPGRSKCISRASKCRMRAAGPCSRTTAA